ncbi:hypothetical protein [Sinorhizobium fredii]|uniref:hypothetical protein n=1 Tax=Rhizobium fredii TaxID=380 RepID=UPI0005956533|nr:hypothetical protein [Sinorhizobium fredii]WOS65659.1 hypothetical protein SFGR64A_29840 [Sinorhizobium fredii GR64]
MANPLRHVDIVDHRFLRPGRSAQILIVDCREPKPDDYRCGNLSPELMQPNTTWWDTACSAKTAGGAAVNDG